MQTEYSFRRSVVALLMVFTLIFAGTPEISSHGISSPDSTVNTPKKEIISAITSQNETDKNTDTTPVSEKQQTVSGIKTEIIDDTVTEVIQNSPETQSSAETQPTETHKPADTTPELPEEPFAEVAPGTEEEKTTVIHTDDVIESISDNIVTAPSYTEKENVNIIPATVNNTIMDSLQSVITTNIYTFTVTERGAVIYAFNHINSEVKSALWYITLYEEYSPDGSGRTVDYRAINTVSYTSIGTGIRSASIGVLPGNYRIEVECISGYTQEKYHLAIGFAETAFYETEPNNTASRYTELSPGTTINGAASVYKDNTTDTDYYMFRITDTGYSVLYFTHEGAVDNNSSAIAWKISISDLDGNVYYDASTTAEKTEINSGIIGLPPGYYFVTVNSHIYSNIAYSLNLSFTGDFSIENETNDTPETATMLDVNTEKIGSLTYRDKVADKDYYSFTMNNDGFISLDFIHSELTDTYDGWNISLIDSAGKTIYSTISKWNQAITKTPDIGLPEGTYYIKIDSDNLYHSNIVYRLILIMIQNNNWETEPNNSPADADIITPGTPISGTMIENGTDYDTDWFSFKAEKDGILSIEFSHIKIDEKNKEGWSVSVIDKSGNIIRNFTSDWDESEKTVQMNVKAGEYYIIVETGLFFNSSRYMLLCNLN